MIIYLAGKYSGNVDENIAAAEKVAVELWDKGYYVLSPHMNSARFENHCKFAAYNDFLFGYMDMLRRCDAVVFLPNWQDSKGANVEYQYATSNGVRVYEYPDLPVLRSPLVSDPALFVRLMEYHGN